jgi:hypothetical protein
MLKHVFQLSTCYWSHTPERPGDDDVSFNGYAECAVDWSGLRDEAERVDTGDDVGKDVAVVEREKEGALGVAIHGRETKRE